MFANGGFRGFGLTPLGVNPTPPLSLSLGLGLTRTSPCILPGTEASAVAARTERQQKHRPKAAECTRGAFLKDVAAPVRFLATSPAPSAFPFLRGCNFGLAKRTHSRKAPPVYQSEYSWLPIMYSPSRKLCICMYVKIRRHQHTRVHAHTGPRRHARAPACRRHRIPRLVRRQAFHTDHHR